jgi:hypothetical protein
MKTHESLHVGRKSPSETFDPFVANGYITRLLKTNSVQNVSKYVETAPSVHSTMSYFRYVIDKQAILETIKDAKSCSLQNL